MCETRKLNNLSGNNRYILYILIIIQRFLSFSLPELRNAEVILTQLCVARGFSRAVLRKISSVYRPLSLSFSSLTASRSAVDETTSEKAMILLLVHASRVCVFPTRRAASTSFPDLHRDARSRNAAVDNLSTSVRVRTRDLVIEIERITAVELRKNSRARDFCIPGTIARSTDLTVPMIDGCPDFLLVRCLHRNFVPQNSTRRELMINGVFVDWRVTTFDRHRQLFNYTPYDICAL